MAGVLNDSRRGHLRVNYVYKRVENVNFFLVKYDEYVTANSDMTDLFSLLKIPQQYNFILIK